MTIKQQIREALREGDNQMVLKLLKRLEEPKPKKLSKLDQPYQMPFTIV
jgi:hypothetical protein